MSKVLVKINFNLKNGGKEITFGKIKPYIYKDSTTGETLASASFKVYAKSGEKLISFDLNTANYSMTSNTFSFYEGGETTVRVYEHDTQDIRIVSRETVLKGLFGYTTEEVNENEKADKTDETDFPF